MRYRKWASRVARPPGVGEGRQKDAFLRRNLDALTAKSKCVTDSALIRLRGLRGLRSRFRGRAAEGHDVPNENVARPRVGVANLLRLGVYNACGRSDTLHGAVGMSTNLDAHICTAVLPYRGARIKFTAHTFAGRLRRIDQRDAPPPELVSHSASARFITCAPAIR
ncbi:unnamed protein product, partial [Iphiclides podalirius]